MIAGLVGARPQDPHEPPMDAVHRPEEIRLPDGKLQSEAILKADHEQSLKEARQLVELAQALQKDLEQEGSQHLLSLADIHKTEEIEKIAKRMRSRMRKY